MSRLSKKAPGALLLLLAVLVVVVAARTAEPPPTDRPPGRDEPLPDREQLLRGRMLVLHHGCGDCHGGYANPSFPGFLAGPHDSTQVFSVGPFTIRPRNITPDNRTGIGRFSERQLFNALRFGLRPGETPDVEITSNVPGEGNFPNMPKYLAPPMPWTAFRHMTDQELWDIAAYLKYAVKPVENRVADNEGPPDFWASLWGDEAVWGVYPIPDFPAASEVAP